MKITTFDPLIVSSKADDIIKLFEELGFEQRHHSEVLEGMNVTSTRMANENGFHVDVASADDVKQDITFIRMNVDDIEEACNKLVMHGFVAPSNVIDKKSSRTIRMMSPSGFGIVLCKHIKDHD